MERQVRGPPQFCVYVQPQLSGFPGLVRFGLRFRSLCIRRAAEDAELLGSARQLVDVRPTYGYRRIGKVPNRERAAAGLHGLNHKRMYRLMA
jgi:hypothetical protein